MHLVGLFDRKADKVESWFIEKQRLISQDSFGYKAIETGITEYEDSLREAISFEQELQNENYHDIERISSRFV